MHPHCTGQKFSSPKCLGCGTCNSIFHCVFRPQQKSQAPSMPAPVHVCKAQALTSGGQLPLCPGDITIYWASLNLTPYSFSLSVHLSPLYININIRKPASSLSLYPHPFSPIFPSELSHVKSSQFLPPRWDKVVSCQSRNLLSPRMEKHIEAVLKAPQAFRSKAGPLHKQVDTHRRSERG